MKNVSISKHSETIKTTTFYLYSFLASAFINADVSGFSDDDEREFSHAESRIIQETGQCVCIGVKDDTENFTRPEIALNRNVYGNCLEFIFLIAK